MTQDRTGGAGTFKDHATHHGFDTHAATMSNDLFDYDAGLDELLAETTEQNGNDPNPSASNPSAQKPPTNDTGLGLDEEIKVTRKRAPIPKLDENRLLSQAGIPKLRQKAKKLKYKGKGHEFSYAAKLLTLYQLWLDDLYPRAKFADALSIVEKLGHSKRMQVMRKEWINEDKPKPRMDTYEEETGTSASGDTAPTGDSIDRMDLDDAALGDNVGGEVPQNSAPSNPGGRTSIFGDGTRTTTRNTRSIFDDDDDEDLFVSDPNTASKPSDHVPDNAAPDEDDLDALLAETEQNDSTATSNPGPNSLPSRPTVNNDDYDDDLEAMNTYGL